MKLSTAIAALTMCGMVQLVAWCRKGPTGLCRLWGSRKLGLFLAQLAPQCLKLAKDSILKSIKRDMVKKRGDVCGSEDFQR